MKIKPAILTSLEGTLTIIVQIYLSRTRQKQTSKPNHAGNKNVSLAQIHYLNTRLKLKGEIFPVRTIKANTH
jgi:hypothetical protein